MSKIFDLNRVNFLIAFLLCTYTASRVISNSMLFYGHEQSLVMIFTEWLYWFKNMPIWWPSHFIICLICAKYISKIFLIKE